METTTTPTSLAAMPLPSVQHLHDLMISLGCRTRDGSCITHAESLLVHDGGRVACRAAWVAAEQPPAVLEVPAELAGAGLDRPTTVVPWSGGSWAL